MRVFLMAQNAALLEDILSQLVGAEGRADDSAKRQQK
jgi:hypothetical protein